MLVRDAQHTTFSLLNKCRVGTFSCQSVNLLALPVHARSCALVLRGERHDGGHCLWVLHDWSTVLVLRSGLRGVNEIHMVAV